MKTIEIEQNFEIESLKRFLEKNPEQSMEIALDFFEALLSLSKEIQILEALNQNLIELLSNSCSVVNQRP